MTLDAFIKCNNFAGTSNGVVFIDGTVSCYDTNWNILIAVVVLLCLVPVVFAVALRLNKLPEDARPAVCGAYTAPMFYWGAVMLGFRLLVSVTLFLPPELPNFVAFIRLFLTTCMFFLLVHLRPYNHIYPFWVDVICHLCLIAQFGLQTIFADKDYLGIQSSEISGTQNNFYQSLPTLIGAFRFEFSSTCLFVCALK